MEPRRLRVERHTVRMPNLAQEWRGARIALLSDIQVGMPLGNDSVVADAVRRVLRLRPAAVLLAGDFILHTREDPRGRIATVVDLLRPIPRAGLRAVAVLGNHDWDGSHQPPRPAWPLQCQVTDALEAIGVTVLENRAIQLPPPRRPAAATLTIVGLGEARRDRDDAEAALSGVPAEAPRIVVMHNPAAFPGLPPGTAPLAVAGHTHGSQVKFLPNARVPWWMRLARMPGDLRHGSGWVEADFGAPGNRLYITRGIGFSGAPVRITAPPELTLFTLARA